MPSRGGSKEWIAGWALCFHVLQRGWKAKKSRESGEPTTPGAFASDSVPFPFGRVTKDCEESSCACVYVCVCGLGHSPPHLRGSRSYGVPEKADRFGLFVAMAVGSVAGLIGMRVFKPKKKEKK